MQRRIKIIVVSLASLFYAGYLRAQSQPIKQFFSATGNLRFMRSPLDSTGTSPSSKKAVPVDFYSQHLAFFCEKELKLEKATGVPFRFRLGSVESCNRLEGKR